MKISHTYEIKSIFEKLRNYIFIIYSHYCYEKPKFMRKGYVFPPFFTEKTEIAVVNDLRFKYRVDNLYGWIENWIQNGYNMSNDDDDVAEC